MLSSPRDRRLKSDYEAMNRLRAESSIISFQTRGTPPDHYTVTFLGPGTWRDPKTNQVAIRQEHIVTVGLTAAYPRMIPELAWKTPIFHPNVSASGVVCLGAYQTNWVPSLKLDELCLMLWDMIRYQNYDVESPYNREAAIWARANDSQFPLDARPLRDRHVKVSSLNETSDSPVKPSVAAPPTTEPTANRSAASTVPAESQPRRSDERVVEADMVFIEGDAKSADVIEAELLDDEGQDILFID